ncbi:MAG: alpha/beta hydrolase [Synechocystis sp.]
MTPLTFRTWLTGLLLIGGVSVGIAPAQAAEDIILKYSILRESISVQELGELSRTGKVSPSLKSYLKLAKKDPEELRHWLNRPFPVEQTTLSNVLNSFFGGYILNQVGEVIHTPSKRASKEALRGAIITSAAEDNTVQLIEVLENYPTKEVHLEGDRLMELYQTAQGLKAKLSKLPF